MSVCEGAWLRALGAADRLRERNGKVKRLDERVLESVRAQSFNGVDGCRPVRRQIAGARGYRNQAGRHGAIRSRIDGAHRKQK